MDPDLPVESPADKTYAISGKIMLSAIVILFAVVVFMVCLHLYARWYALRLRRRRHRPGAVIYVDNHVNPRSVADRGLEQSVLNSLPLIVYATKAAAQPPLPAECAVCLSEFGPSEVVRLLPKCRHTFHVDCIGMWFHSHSTCPLCRSPVEAVVSLGEPPAAAEERNGPDSSSSSETGAELCTTCQHEEEGSNTMSLWGRRKSIIDGGILGISIETPAAAAGNELTQSSPGGRLLSLKRIFSMTRKTPTGSSGSGATPHGTVGETSGAAELDLEDGSVSQAVRVGSPCPR